MATNPLVVVIVNAVFGSIVFRRFLDRRRPYQLVWTVPLALGFLARVLYPPNPRRHVAVLPGGARRLIPVIRGLPSDILEWRE